MKTYNLLFTNRYSLIQTFTKIKNSKIYCEKDSFAEKFCKQKKIIYKTYSSRNDFYKILKKNLNHKIFTNGCKYLIPKHLLKKQRFIPLNIHPSLLPNFRGKYPINRIFYNKEKYIGITIHQIDEGIDTGKILHQKKFKVKKNYLIINFYHKHFHLEKVVFEQFFFKKKKINLRLKKKKELLIKKKKKYKIEDLKELPVEYIQSQCVPKKYLKAIIGSKLRKIVHCQEIKTNLFKDKKFFYLYLSKNHILIRNIKKKNLLFFCL